MVETQVWDQMTPKFLAAHRAGNAPDIIWAITDFLGDAINSGSLADLNALFMNKWPAAQVADHKSAYWDLTKRGDKQYALFVSPNYISVLYRADLFKEAGIDPAQIKTWDDLRQAAEKLTVRDASGQVTRYGYAQAYSEQQTDPHMMIPYILGNGESIFKPDGKANFATPLGIEAMTYATDLVTKYKVAPSAVRHLDGRRPVRAVRLGSRRHGAGPERARLHHPGQARQGKGRHDAVARHQDDGALSGRDGRLGGRRLVEGPECRGSRQVRRLHAWGRKSEKIWVTVGGQSPLMASTAEAVASYVDQPGNGYIRVAGEGSPNMAG